MERRLARNRWRLGLVMNIERDERMVISCVCLCLYQGKPQGPYVVTLYFYFIYFHSFLFLSNNNNNANNIINKDINNI